MSLLFRDATTTIECSICNLEHDVNEWFDMIIIGGETWRKIFIYFIIKKNRKQPPPQL